MRVPNYKSVNLVTAANKDPISTDEAKEFLRCTSDSEDGLITSLITTATKELEKYTGRQFISATYQVLLDVWPSRNSGVGAQGYEEKPYWYYDRVSALKLELPFAPLQSVTHIKTYDDSDNATTFSSSNYYVSTPAGDFSSRGSIALRSSGTIPTPTRTIEGLEIQFVCGYGDTGESVPMGIRNAIKAYVSYMYMNRGDGEGKSLSMEGLPKDVLNLIKPYKLPRFI